MTRHFSSIPNFDVGDAEYFKKIETEVDEDFTPGEREYFYLKKLCELISKAGYKKIYVVIDKIDEDPRFQNDAEVISTFIKNIASDNKILTADFFYVLLFIWSAPFRYIKSSVRTQKLTFEELKWTHSALISVLEKRLETFSNGALSSYLNIFSEVSPENLNLIFELSNSNPRDLWHIVNRCFSEQFKIDASKKIGDEAICGAVEKFITEFNYYEYYPRRVNARATTMDVYGYIKHLLKLDAPEFTTDKLNTMAGTGSSSAKYVVGMERMGLVAKSKTKGRGGSVIYKILDPKVRYAMLNSISISP